LRMQCVVNQGDQVVICAALCGFEDVLEISQTSALPAEEIHNVALLHMGKKPVLRPPAA
jgi:hypothetical protein